MSLLLSGGTVLVDGARVARDVLVDGSTIAAIAEPGRVDGGGARVVDVAGKLVLPGLVDMHTHTYWAGNRLGITPDKNAARSGVTTWVDAGTAGAGGLEGLVEHVVRRSRVRVLPFINLSYIGIATAGMMTNEVGELFDARFADLRAVLRTAQELPGMIHGVKVRASANTIAENSGSVLPLAREAARALGVPLMVHIGMAPPTIGEVLPHLDAGDLITHCFHPHAGGTLLDPSGRVRDAVAAAVERGVLLDVGHGVASIGYDVARACLAQGCLPHTISSDLHAENIDWPVGSLLQVMTTFLGLGLSLEQVIAGVTTAPAAALGRTDIGTLAVGGIADVAVLDLVEHARTLQDTLGQRLAVEKEFRHVLTVCGGEILEPYDDGRHEGRTSPWQVRFGASAD